MSREEQLGVFSATRGTLSSDISQEELDAAEAFERQQKEFERAAAKLADQKKRESWKGVDITPYGQYMFVKEYSENPYTSKYNEEGLILDGGGIFTNPDTGEQEIMNTGIKIALVVKVSPAVKGIKPGDEVMYPSAPGQGSTLPIPFMHLGYRLINHGSVTAVITKSEEHGG